LRNVAARLAIVGSGCSFLAGRLGDRLTITYCSAGISANSVATLEIRGKMVHVTSRVIHDLRHAFCL